LYTLISNKILLQWEKENKIVKNLGGLFVLGTERHETRRIDNQLRGRAGRQGDPGIAQFFVSLDDNLFKIFGGQNIRNFLSQLMDDPTLPMESSFLTKSLENAQAKVESLNYETRKNVFQYDDVLNMQRNQIFKIRRAILFSTSLEKLFLSYHEFDLDKKFSKLLLKKKNKEDLLNTIKNLFDFYSLTGLEFENINTNKKKKEISLEFYKLLWIKHDYHFSHGNAYQLGFHLPEQTDDLLSFIDKAWTEHLEKMSYIRETINWKSYGQKNPLTEYNVQSCESFKLLYEKIRLSVIYYFQNSPINHL
jgi:preprotein translocase subunit SecA